MRCSTVLGNPENLFLAFSAGPFAPDAFSTERSATLMYRIEFFINANEKVLAAIILEI